MAKRRMFSRDVIDTDHFLEMPMTAQVLYFHLALRADDDGFVASPKRIMRLIGVGEDDMKILVAKSFIIPFETGICVIRHWKIHNYIQKDRYSPTTYQEEFNMLKENTNRTYDLDTECIQSGYILDTQDRLGKDRLGKDRLDIVGNGKDNSVQMYDKCTPEIELEIEKKKEIKKELEKYNTCDEFSNETSSPIFISLPKIGSPSSPSKIYHVTEEYLAKLEATYPAVDVRQQLREMKHWLEVNPTKKKVNVPAFIARWLAKDQDRGGGIQSSPPKKSAMERALEIIGEQK